MNPWLHRMKALGGAIALLFTAGAAAAQADVTLDDRIAPIFNMARAGDCRGAAKALAAVERAGLDVMSEMIGGVEYVLRCMPPKRQATEINIIVERAAKRAPDDFRIALYGSAMATELANPAMVEHWTTVLASRFPNIVGRLAASDFEIPLMIVEEKGKPARDQLALRLGAAGLGTNPKDLLRDRDSFLRETAMLAEAAGQPDLARQMLLRMLDATEIGYALVDRRLEAHWPALEAAVGPAMGQATRKAMEVAREVFAAEPQRAEARLNLMLALWAAGARDEALQLGGDFAKIPEELAILDWDGRHLVDMHARMLLTAGRLDEADRRYAEVTRAGANRPERFLHLGYHRAQMLSHAGRHEEALALIPALRQTAKKQDVRPTQRGLLRTEICSRVALGRRDGVDALKAELLALGKDERAGHTAEALLCLGDRDAAAAALIRLLADADGRIWAFETLQPERLLIFDDPCIWSLETLLERPDVAKALADVGRILPSHLVPPARQQRSI